MIMSSMLKRVSTLILAAGFAASALTLTAAEEKDPAITPTTKVELFNGKDFTGWEFCHKTDVDPKTVWRVEDGVIKCVGKPTGYARTAKAYKNYQVTVEWRFIKPGNTGVCVHMQSPDKVWPATIECQGQHDKQGDFWLQGGATCKDHNGTTREQRYIPMREPSNEKPVGEWNTFQVVCRDAAVKIIVNGKLMNETSECSVSSGFIGLQSEGAEMEVRKVTLEPLPGKS
jgi:hypothetical protein